MREGDPIDLDRLNLRELVGVVNLYPWYAGARMCLCRRIAQSGGEAWGTAQYAEAALYMGSRSLVAQLLRDEAHPSDYADKDLSALLQSYIAPEKQAEPRRETSSGGLQRRVTVPGGDYFSNEQYSDVATEEDKVFGSFAIVKDASDPGEVTSGGGDEELFCTETLAQIYAEQGYPDQAKRIYSRLRLNLPEKSAYFAALIAELES